MKLIALLFCVLLTIIDQIQKVRPQAPYIPPQNQLPINGDCERRVQSDARYQACRARAYENWLPITDETERVHYTCCFNWDIYDCMENAMEYVCGSRGSLFDYGNSFSRRYEWIRNQETYMCAYYPYGSYKCHFPGWAIALIVLGSILLLAVICGVVFMAVKKRRNTKARDWQSYSKTSKKSNTELKTTHNFEET